MLDSEQAWSAGTAAAGQWMTIDLGTSRQVVGVAIQGRRANSQHVTSFTVQHSMDGVSFASLPTTFTSDSTATEAQTVWNQPYRTNTGVGGWQFDIVADQDVVITQFSIAFNGGTTSHQTYDLFKLTDTGSHSCCPFNRAAWTQIHSAASTASVAYDTGSTWTTGQLTQPFSVFIAAGDTQAFYVHGRSRGLVTQRSGSSRGPQASNADLELWTGTGIASAVFSTGYSDDYVCAHPLGITYRSAAPTAAPTATPTGQATARVMFWQVTARHVRIVVQTCKDWVSMRAGVLVNPGQFRVTNSADLPAS